MISRVVCTRPGDQAGLHHRLQLRHIRGSLQYLVEVHRALPATHVREHTLYMPHMCTKHCSIILLFV